MRNFDTLDTYAFKAFWIATETLNFTEAAKSAGMTQSGISQHISRLEQQLGVPLFLRVNKKVLLTEAAKKLKSYIERYLDDMGTLKELISSEYSSLTGDVSYAMPESCLMSPHFGLLLKARKKNFPELGLKVSICSSEDVIGKVLNDEIHFGFVTKAIKNPAIKLTPFCLEEYILVSGDKELESVSSPEDVKPLLFIGHPGVETYFLNWFHCFFPKSKQISWSDLRIIGEMGSLKGAIEMVKNGMGVTVIAEHCVRDNLKKKELFCVSSSKKGAAVNPIYIATLNTDRLPRRVEIVIETFLKMIGDKGGDKGVSLPISLKGSGHNS